MAAAIKLHTAAESNAGRHTAFDEVSVAIDAVAAMISTL